MTQKPLFALIPPESTSLNEVSTAVPIDQITSSESRLLIDAMLGTASGLQGDAEKRTLVGLAAPQLGVSKRIIVVDVTSSGMGEAPDLRVYINPVIVERSAAQEAGREGCFSTGNVCGIVQRAAQVTVEAYDRDGKPVQEQHQGFTARIFQHEIDHLDGVRFPDRITDDKKLHWVVNERFGDYREHWQDWDEYCPRSTWEAIKKQS